MYYKQKDQTKILIWGYTEYLVENQNAIDWSCVVAVVSTRLEQLNFKIFGHDVILPEDNYEEFDYIYMADKDQYKDVLSFIKHCDDHDDDCLIGMEYITTFTSALFNGINELIIAFVLSNMYLSGIRTAVDVNGRLIDYGYKSPHISWPNISFTVSDKYKLPYYKTNLYKKIEHPQAALFLDPFFFYDSPEDFESILLSDYLDYQYVCFNLPREVEYPAYLYRWATYGFSKIRGLVRLKHDYCGSFCAVSGADITRCKYAARMYIVSHKAFKIPKLDECYKPIYVGGFAGDNSKDTLNDLSGDSISRLNPLINEATAIYWIWKNDRQSDIVGIVHYRRFFFNDDRVNLDRHFLGQLEIEQYLQTYDMIVAGIHMEWWMTISERLSKTIDKRACREAMDIVESLIRIKQPDYLEAFHHVFNGHSFFPCNMFITRKEIFDKYCQWLFDIIPDACEQFHPERYDDYSKRAIGFVTERLLTVWLMNQNLKVKEQPIQQLEV